jgi:hypothetical protein
MWWCCQLNWNLEISFRRNGSESMT